VSALHVEPATYSAERRLIPHVTPVSVVLHSAALPPFIEPQKGRLATMRDAIEAPRSDQQSCLKPFGTGHDITYSAETFRIEELNFLLPRKHWQPLAGNYATPTPVARVGLTLAAPSVSASGDELSDIIARAYMLPDERGVMIELAEDVDNGQPYALSESSFAILGGGELKAVIIDMST
jgi:hypothetical protein